MPSVRLPGQAAVVGASRRVSRLFVVLSLVGLGLAGAYLAANPGSEVSVMGATTASRSLDAVGLSYDGGLGLAMLAGQGLLVAGSSLAAWRGRGGLRKAGLVGLLAWSGLWLANGLWLAGATDQMLRVVASWILTGVFAATVVRAMADWPRRAARRPVEPVPEAPAGAGPRSDLIAA